jgi:hypothetical protein
LLLELGHADDHGSYVLGGLMASAAKNPLSLCH